MFEIEEGNGNYSAFDIFRQWKMIVDCCVQQRQFILTNIPHPQNIHPVFEIEGKKERRDRALTQLTCAEDDLEASQPHDIQLDFEGELNELA